MAPKSLSAFVMILLNVAWYFVAIALVLTACLLCLLVISPRIGSDGTRIDIPVSFDIDERAVPVSAPSLEVESALIEHVRGSMSFQPPSRGAVAAPMTLVAIMLAIILWVLSQLIAVFRTLRDRRPFDPRNAIRIRRIGYAVIAGEIARAALIFWANSYAVRYFTAQGLRFDARPDLNLVAIVHGLIILAIAEVFRAGTRLDEDQSLTI